MDEVVGMVEVNSVKWEYVPASGNFDLVVNYSEDFPNLNLCFRDAFHEFLDKAESFVAALREQGVDDETLRDEYMLQFYFDDGAGVAFEYDAPLPERIFQIGMRVRRKP